jgi:hypothetical protein
MRERRAVAAIVAAAACAQLWLAHRYFGFLTGDEVEVLAEAFRRARGFPFAPWNIRNLFVPDVVVAPAIRLASALGVHSTRALVECAALPFVAFSALTIVCVWRLAVREEDEGLRGFAVSCSRSDLPPDPATAEPRNFIALAAALLVAFHWIPLGFGSTAYPRNLAMLCVVAAALLVERRPLLAGLLAGIAFADRFSEIVFLIPLLIIAKQRLRVAAGAALSIAVTVGVYDWITWGAPFASAIRFAKLTLLEPDFASRVKYQPPWWYLANLARWLALPLLVPLWMARRHRLWWFVGVPLIAFSLVRHKELRYLQVLIPFVMILEAIGLAKLPRRWGVPLLAVSLLWNAWGLRYFARKSMPAVLAAEAMSAEPTVGNVVLSQLWAYGDRLYFGSRIAVGDVGSPPRNLAAALRSCDTVSLWETDLDDPSILALLRANGFTQWRTFRDGAARAVVVFRRLSS